MNCFHIDVGTGNVHRCTVPERCGWAEPDEHYPNPNEARAAFEAMAQPFAWVRFHKRSAGHRHVMELLSPVR